MLAAAQSIRLRPGLHWLLHALEILVALVVLLPLVSRVRVANQALAAHLRRVQDGCSRAAPALRVPVVRHHERCLERLKVLLLLIRYASPALIAAEGRWATRKKRGQMRSARRYGRRRIARQRQKQLRARQAGRASDSGRGRLLRRRRDAVRHGCVQLSR
jgi:hypothetical protein